MTTPLLIVGDAPFRSTGLSRILTDLLRGLCGDYLPVIGPHGERNEAMLAHHFEVGTVGYQPWAGLPRVGVPRPTAKPDGRMIYGWRHNWAFSDLTHHGVEAVSTAYRAWFGDRQGILLSIWDPSRCFAFTELDLPVEKWGYFPIDAANMNGGISGPAGAAVNDYDRVLAYTNFGKQVLETATDLPVEVLPHGMDRSIFRRAMTEIERLGMIARIFPAGYGGQILVGCVATNQPRKDLGLFAQVLWRLRERGLNVHGWLHTDRLISEAWSIPQLAADAGITDHLTVTLQMSDRELAIAYGLCAATIAPGRGEGFGYPIVESLSCGTPAYHAHHGGGAEFTPYLIPPQVLHVTGPYALARPILSPGEVADRIASDWRRQGETPEAHARTIQWCEMFTQKLDWPILWPSWADWFQRGLDTFEEKAHD